jgi:GH24 family phage-related lysozyme (muramidase)
MKRLVIINLILIMILYIIPEPIKSEQVSVQASEQVITSRSLTEHRSDIVEEIEPKIIIATEISQEGIDFIKSFEGCRLEAYQNKGETHYTIGYGHYGSDVKAGQVITQEVAERLLKADLVGYTELVLKECEYLELKQNELDALVSFTYNAGIGSLKKLTANGTRTKEEIAEHITAYTKSSSEANRKGLTKRRLAEKNLFLGGE